MIYSPALRYEYMDVPKTGTQSVRRILIEHYSGVNGGMHQICNRAEDGYFSWGVVRNPYERAISMWWSTCMRDGDRYGFKFQLERRGMPNTLECFMRVLLDGYTHSHLGPCQSKILRGIRLDAVLHTEMLEEEFVNLPFYNGTPTVWPHLNATRDSRKDWREYVTGQAAELVVKWAQEDFARFGYAYSLQNVHSRERYAE